jgi:hypothetical protein
MKKIFSSRLGCTKKQHPDDMAPYFGALKRIFK